MNTRIILFIITAGIFQSCTGKKDTPPEQGFRLTATMQQSIRVDTTKIEAVKTELRFSAKVTPADNKVGHVFPIVAGFVTHLNVSLGDYVKKGQVLASIRSTDLADFEKQRRDAENDLLLSRRNLKSTQELYEAKLNTERDLAIAMKELENDEAELNRINEVLHIYHAGKGSVYNVVAPISGFIIDKKINADMQLPPGITESIFTIAQIDEVYITANVYEGDIPHLSENMPAEVEILTYPGKRLKGKIDRILNILDPETRTLKIRIRLPNPGYDLKPEMAATVYIRKEEKMSLPAVPAEAIVFDNSRNYVLVYHREDSIETRTVEPLRTISGITFISSGLQPGERVISVNALLVYDALND